MRDRMRRISMVTVGLAVTLMAVISPGPAFAAGPTAVDDSYSMRGNTGLIVSGDRGLLHNDIDVSSDSTVALTTDVQHGDLALLANGWFSYQPAASFVGTDAFVYCLVDPATHNCILPGATVTLTVTVTVIERVSGIDRYATSAAVSAAAFTPEVDTVYVASGEGFPDALSASSAAGERGGPVLLVQRSEIPSAIDVELRRLKPDHIVVLGGVNAVAPEVETDLNGYGADVRRVGGADRYAVSAAVSSGVFAPSRSVVYIASGEAFPDALSGSPAAGWHGSPVLLVQKNAVPDAIVAELTRLKPPDVVLLGGIGALSDTVRAEIDRITGRTSTRIDGTDRFETSAAVSRSTFRPLIDSTVYVASGETFADALSGAAAAISAHAPVLLVTRDGVPGATAAELDRMKPGRIVVLGGTDAISDATYAELGKHLG